MTDFELLNIISEIHASNSCIQCPLHHTMYGCMLNGRNITVFKADILQICRKYKERKMRLIDAIQPTSYDVKKVVEELDDLDIYFDNDRFTSTGEELLLKEEVMKIVRRGGNNETD